MANNQAFKIKNGLSAKRYLQNSTAVSASDVDLSTGSYFTKTLSANTTFTFSNPPASGKATGFALEVTGGSASVGGDLSGASYDSVSFYVGGQETNPFGIEFKSDGTKMFIAGTTGDDITEYSISTAWDITTASHTTQVSVSGQQVNPKCVRFSSDGTKMYVSNTSNTSITTYTLSTAWDVSSVSGNATTTLTNGSITASFWFKSDGTRLFQLDGATVRSYTLSTAWDVSSISADAGTLTVAYGHSIVLTSDGTKIFTSQETGSAGIIHEYVMTTAYDLSTGSSSGTTFDASTQDIRPYGMTIKPDDTKLFISGGTNDTIYQYSIVGTATATTTWPSSVKWSGATAPDAPASGEKDVYVFVTTDGGTTYYGKQAGDAVA